MLEAIKKAKTDDKIKGISIETDGLRAGFTQLDDIRNALEDFKQSGKFVYAYGNSVSQPAYYLGSVADQYILNPAGGIDLKEVNFKTMESKVIPNVYFAGEILNMDAITGGFNFQNAWTSGFIVAENI